MSKSRPRRVLDVGQCGFDHAYISRMVVTHFDAEVDQAHTIDEALRMAATGDYDLVLVNRILDHSGAEGLELVARLKATSATQDTPVMLVSNYEDAQQSAVAAGAVPGFGKAQLNEPTCRTLFAPYLT